MKKLMLILMVVILVGSVSAEMEWDNWKYYDEETKTITIKNNFILKTLEKATLLSNTYNCAENCRAEKEITLYGGGVLIDDLRFYRLFTNGSKGLSEPRRYSLKYYADVGETFYINKKTLKNGTVIKELKTIYNGENLRWIDYELGTEVMAGTYQVRLEGKKKINRIYEWEIQMQGRWITEWATWGNISLGDDAEVLLVSPADNTTAQVGDTIWFNATANVTGGPTLDNMSYFSDYGGTWGLNETINLIGIQYRNIHGIGMPEPSLPLGTFSGGVLVNMTSDGWVQSMEKGSGDGGTFGYIADVGMAVIQNASFVGDIATFDPPVKLNDTYQYWFLTDKEGASFNHNVSGEVSPFPIADTHFIWYGATLWTDDLLQFARIAGIWSMNISNQSSVSATYSSQNFSKYVENDTLWNVQGCDSDGACGFAVSNRTVRIIPIINVFSPTNTSYTTSTIYFNATNSTPVDTWIVNYNGTNVTLSSINTTLEVEDGNHQAIFYANSSSGFFNINDSIYFIVDTNAPTLNVTAPFGNINFGVGTTNETLRFNVSDINLDTCFYDYNSANVTTDCTVNITNFTIGSPRTLTFWANDTFGNLVSDIVTWTYIVFENSQDFNNETLEGTLETFTANVTIEVSRSITVANFVYNGTSNIGSFTEFANYSTLTIDLTIPDASSEINLTFFWSLLLSDSQIINITSNNQTVITLNLDDCSSNTIMIYNYTIVDEKEQTLLANTTAELNIVLLNLEREVFIANFSREYSENSFSVCLNENVSSSSFVIDSVVKYEAIGYSIEYYNIVNASITNSTIPQNITLYDLNSSDATEFKITFKDEDFSFIEDALIFIDRQYISENGSFKTVELPKTDSNGQTIGHFVRNDVIYNIRVIKNGELLGNFQNQIAFCEDIAIGNCQMVLEAQPSDSVTFDYNEQLGIIFESTPTYNENTSSISFDFSSDDGSVKIVTMEVTRNDIFGNRSICNNTIASTSGTLSCSFDPNIDDSTLKVDVFVNGQQAVISRVTLEGSDYGNLGYVFWFILTFLFILIFGNSKTEVLIGLSVSLIGAIALGITRGDIVGVGSAGIWMLVIVILGIWKINKENPQ